VGASVFSASLQARDMVLKRNAREAARSAANAAPASVAAPAQGAPTPTYTAPPDLTGLDLTRAAFPGDRIIYEADLSAMYSGGNTGTNFTTPPGGFDASLTYRFLPTTRAYAGYFQFSAQPLGTDDPSIPVVFQGTKTPIAFANGQQMHLDATTHLRFQIYQLQQLFSVGGRHHPLILVPTYVAVRSIIAGKDDSGPIYANGQFMTVHQRSYETKGLNLNIPLFYNEHYLISYTGGPIWNVNSNGANQTNHPQLYQAATATYSPTPDLTYFVNALSSITYFPTEVYPYHTPTLHVGFAKVLRNKVFFEAEMSSGGPSNPNYAETGRIGVVNLTVPCAATAAGLAPNLPCVAAANNGVAAPTVGGQRYTTFSLMIGIGQPPLVRPF
jgi:hypothetical protein